MLFYSIIMLFYSIIMLFYSIIIHFFLNLTYMLIIGYRLNIGEFQTGSLFLNMKIWLLFFAAKECKHGLNLLTVKGRPQNVYASSTRKLCRRAEG